ncbi:MAG: hypothetical protein AVDCRST_MAG15-771, partial [uncultured Rubellimicrobium sp.]
EGPQRQHPARGVGSGRAPDLAGRPHVPCCRTDPIGLPRACQEPCV